MVRNPATLIATMPRRRQSRRRLAVHRHRGVRNDRAVAEQIVEAVSEHAVDAAIQAAEHSVKADNEIRQALCRELEEARYEASLATRRYEFVDPAKRLVARELETRWNTALEWVAHLEIASRGMMLPQRFARKSIARP
jgi:hypothetical protein